MRQLQAIQLLHSHCRTAPPVFSKRDLEVLMPHAKRQSFDATLRRLVDSGVLVRAAYGIYVNALSPTGHGSVLDQIARALRRSHHSYVSLESALSRHGVISEVPMRLTLMTTGRSGEFDTPYGTIEFTHTTRSVNAILEGTVHFDAPLRFAKKWMAYQDLKHVGRNLDLVDHEALHDDDWH